LSFLSGVDFSCFDLDAPLPELRTNASRSLTMLYTSGTGAKTLREALSDPASGGVDFVGTPDSIAAEMGEAIAEIGGDGFMITEGLIRAHGRRDLRRARAGAEAARPDAVVLQPPTVPGQPARILTTTAAFRARHGLGICELSDASIVGICSKVGHGEELVRE
jgi:hypothetical protein